MAGRALARPSSKARAEGRTILFVDEAGFYLLPFVARTYAPRGQTPVLRTPLTRDHLSAISAITLDGRLFTHIQTEAFRGPAVVAFLRQLLRQVPGKLLVIWDGAPIHHCQPVKDSLAAGAATRFVVQTSPMKLYRSAPFAKSSGNRSRWAAVSFGVAPGAVRVDPGGPTAHSSENDCSAR